MDDDDDCGDVIMAMKVVMISKVLMILILGIRTRLMMGTTVGMILTMMSIVASSTLVQCASAR